MMAAKSVEVTVVILLYSLFQATLISMAKSRPYEKLTGVKLEYKIFPQKRTWLDAETVCRKWGGQGGGHLATIKSKEQNEEFVYKLKKKKLKSAWLGLNDISAENNLTWISSLSRSNYRNFRKGEPNGGAKERCVEMVPGFRWLRNWRGKWNDNSCKLKMPFICERVLNPCDGNAMYESTEGTHTCTCLCGYIGDGSSCTKSDLSKQNIINIKDTCAVGNRNLSYSVKGNFLGRIDVGSEYEVSFDIFPLLFQQGWTSVLHLSASGKNLQEYGDRNPAVWFHNAQINQLYVCSAVDGDANHCTISEDTALPLEQWSSVTIKQVKHQTTGEYMYSVTVNGATVHKTLNDHARNFTDVKVYVGDPWYPPHIGYLKNLYIGVSRLQPPQPVENQKSKSIVIVVVVAVLLLITLVVAVFVVMRTWRRCKKTEKTSSHSTYHSDAVDDPRAADVLIAGHSNDGPIVTTCESESENPYYSSSGGEYACIASVIPEEKRGDHEYTYIDPNAMKIDGLDASLGTSQRKFQNLSLDTKNGKFAKYISTSNEHLYKEPSGVDKYPAPGSNKEQCHDIIYDDPGKSDEPIVYDDPDAMIEGYYEPLSPTNQQNDYVSPGAHETDIYEPLGITTDSEYRTINRDDDQTDGNNQDSNVDSNEYEELSTTDNSYQALIV